LARELGVIGLLNIQFALRGSRVYVIEVNPRASRTVPFVSKAVGRPFAKIGALVAAGKTLAELDVAEREPEHVSVKQPVFPFRKFPGVDTVLGPEMRSTGEVMGIGPDFGAAYHHALLAAGSELPRSGTALISVMDEHKDTVMPAAKQLHDLGFRLAATRGTAAAIRAHGLPVREILKQKEGRPNTIDALKNGEIQLVINTTGGTDRPASFMLRRTTLLQRVPYFTTVSGALAAAHAIATARASQGQANARALQDYHARPVSDPIRAPRERVGYR
jgi:carbamoyl-phosphate synthase large subunit